MLQTFIHIFFYKIVFCFQSLSISFYLHSYLSGSADKTVKFWDLETLELIGSAGPEVNTLGSIWSKTISKLDSIFIFHLVGPIFNLEDLYIWDPHNRDAKMELIYLNFSLHVVLFFQHLFIMFLYFRLVEYVV